MQQNFDQVIEILKKEGVSDEQIGKFIEGLSQALSQQLYLTIVEQLSEEDMVSLNNIADEAQRQASMQQIFEQKTNKSLKGLSDEFIKTYTDDFLTGYQSMQSTQPTA